MIVDERNYKIIVIEDNLGDFFLLDEYVNEKIKNPQIKHLERFSEFNNIKNEVDQYDIIFLDLTLPDKSGKELIEEVLKIAKNTPLVVLTGFTDLTYALEAISLGASDYLLKDELNSVALYKSIVYNIERFKNIVKIKESEQLYNNLFELSPQPIFVIDSETHQIIDVNKACEKLYEFKKEELINIPIKTIFKDEETIFDNHQTIITQTHQKKIKRKLFLK